LVASFGGWREGGRRMSPRPDVSAERRAQIIEAALACFTRRGYNNTTMDDIVAASGLSKGTLYWYFKGKDDLFAAAIESFFEGYGQQLLGIVGQQGAASGKLRAGAEEMVRFCEEAQGLFGLFIEFWSQSDRREEAGQLWADVLTRYSTMVSAVIEDGVSSGEFGPVDAESLVWAIMAAYDGLAAYVMLKPDLELDRISAVFVETLLRGLALGEGEPRREGGDVEGVGSV
jgi:AcrR family transcriptional regulator